MAKPNQFDNPSNGFLSSLLPVLEQLSSLTSRQLIDFSSAPWIDSFGFMQKAITSALTMSNRIYLDSMIESLSVVQRYMESISQISINTLATLPNIQETLLTHVVTSLETALPYMDLNQREEYQEEVIPKLEKAHQNKLTLNDILAIISLLVSIYFGIVSSLPDEQLDRISRQNEIIIEQQAELIELEKEDAELRDTLNALADSINLLSDEVESLRNEIENVDDASELDGHSDTENGQQQNDNP